jgi:hypothetical protein
LEAIGPLVLAWALGVLVPASARGESPKVCAEAYEKAQEERKAGRITAAIENLTKCAARDCPSFVSKDCIQWLTDAQLAQPSVVFSVRRDGVELTAVEIAMDGHLLTNAIDGKALALDPGPHVFTFRAVDGPSSEKSFIIREGERNRIIEIDLLTRPRGRESAAQPLAPMNGPRPGELPAATPTRSWLPYGFLGMGVLGVTGFTVFGLWGHSQESDLETSCAPFCRSSQVNEVRTKYIVADACLAVGLVSLGVATYYFLHGRDVPASSTASLLPTVSHRNGVIDVALRF